MKHYIIDGNNLLGKIPSIKKLQKTDKQASREKLAFLLGRYFSTSGNTVTLHFDGYPNESIKVSPIKIKYSASATADDQIKAQIEETENPKNIIVITSDRNLTDFARVCSCQVIKSEEFAKKLFTKQSVDDEQSRIDQMKNPDEFKKLFGAE